MTQLNSDWNRVINLIEQCADETDPKKPILKTVKITESSEVTAGEMVKTTISIEVEISSQVIDIRTWKKV